MRKLLPLVFLLLVACPDPATQSDATKSECLVPDQRGNIQENGAKKSDTGKATLHHILGTGQSLSVGACGNPPLSIQAEFNNKMFPKGPVSGTDLSALVPLCEVGIETMSSGLASLVSQLQPGHDALISLHGVGASPYWNLKKGTAAYALGMEQVRQGRSLAFASGIDYVVSAVTVVHGESAHYDNDVEYPNELLQWQQDYETDIQAITGSRAPLVMFHTQISNWTLAGKKVTTSEVPVWQLQASQKAPDKLVLVGPKYIFPYAADGLHLVNTSYRWLGEYYGKAYREVVLMGRLWKPLWPTSATRSGKRITVVFHVPVPPLVFDTVLVTNPGNYGFKFTDGSGQPPQISSVSLSGNTVLIDLVSEPLGPMPTIHYAMDAPIDAMSGPVSGPRGNLRDSDGTASRFDNTLYNWAVHFRQPVTN